MIGLTPQDACRMQKQREVTGRKSHAERISKLAASAKQNHIVRPYWAWCRAHAP